MVATTIWFGLILAGSILIDHQVSTAETDDDGTEYSVDDGAFISDDTGIDPLPPWMFKLTCEEGLQVWNSCLSDAIQTWSDVDDIDKRYCCASWHLFNCWSYQVGTVCPDIGLTLLEQSRIKLSNQSRCVKYYDISVCTPESLPVWANVLILVTGATIITGVAVFVYWRWIRLI